MYNIWKISFCLSIQPVMNLSLCVHVYRHTTHFILCPCRGQKSVIYFRKKAFDVPIGQP